MELKKDKWFINDILLIQYDESKRSIKRFKKEEITSDLFNNIERSIDNNNIQRIELKNTEKDISMTIFCERDFAHIGIIDMYNDIVHYYTNNSEDKGLVEIAGQMFENDMVCKDRNVLNKILNFFAIHGERYPHAEWIEE